VQWIITDEMARTKVRLYYGVAVPRLINKKSGESMRHKDYRESIAQLPNPNALENVPHMKQFGSNLPLII
jgi:hypothetical protein